MAQRRLERIRLTIAVHHLPQSLELIFNRSPRVEDFESRAVWISIAVEIIFVLDHDGVVQIATHVFGLVGFDAQFWLLADPLSFARERVIAVSGVVAVWGVDGGSR